MGTLYYGDNLDILRRYLKDETVDLVYQVSDVMQAFYTFLGGNDMMAYLTMMSSRLVELRRVLKSTGSLCLQRVRNWSTLN
jgi:hypothetical protein